MEQNTRQPLSSDHESLTPPSVLDFLYHDSRRIGSFLAQFEGDGHVQQLTRTRNGLKAKRSSTTGEASGTLGFAGGKLQKNGETAFQMQVGDSRVVDPYWANARAFLDYLTERNLLQRNLGEANIGQFVIATGYLSIDDLSMFKDAWKLPSIQKKIKGSVGDGKKTANLTAAQKAERREQQENTDLFLDMLQMMPHSVHAKLLSSSVDQARLIWCTLNQDYLVTPPSDITLTYGRTMAGEWSIVGILSAHPEYLTPNMDGQFDDGDTGVLQSIIGQISNLLAPIVRVSLGRPAAAHAVTPLLIFREAS